MNKLSKLGAVEKHQVSFEEDPDIEYESSTNSKQKIEKQKTNLHNLN